MPIIDFSDFIGASGKLTSQNADMHANAKEDHADEGDCVYDYFTFNMDELVYGEDGVLYMPDKPMDAALDSDQDSEDSNREDHEEHDYPEERSSYDGDENHPYRGNQSDDEEEDIEVAASKFNRKQQATK